MEIFAINLSEKRFLLIQVARNEEDAGTVVADILAATSRFNAVLAQRNETPIFIRKGTRLKVLKERTA